MGTNQGSGKKRDVKIFSISAAIDSHVRSLATWSFARSPCGCVGCLWYSGVLSQYQDKDGKLMGNSKRSVFVNGCLSPCKTAKNWYFVDATQPFF